MKIWKYSGIFLIATGILHIIAALLKYGKTYMEIIRDGMVDAIGGDCERGFALWFLVCGILLIFWGQGMHARIKETQRPAPRSVGWSLMVVSIAGCIVEPVSGFWLFLPQAAIIVLAGQKEKQQEK